MSSQINLKTLLNFTTSKTQSLFRQVKSNVVKVTETLPGITEGISKLPELSVKLDRKFSYLDQRIKYYVKPTYLVPRNPIVLCHGLFGFDRLGPLNYPKLQIKYWSGIEECLKKLGCEVFVTKVDRVGTIERRANQLHRQLQARFNYEPINLIGHSMGGLDARKLTALDLPNRKYTIESITSICTPHRGCSFVDWCQDYLKVGLPPTTEKEKVPFNFTYAQNQMVYDIIKKLFEVPAYYNLTSQFLKQFNLEVPNLDSIQYFSVAATTHQPPSHPLLLAPYYIVKGREGPNDGMVSIKSATWGKYLGTLNTTHFQVVSSNRYIQYFNNLCLNSMPKLDIQFNGTNLFETFNLEKEEHLLRDKKHFDPIPFYLDLVTKLNREGL